MTVWITGANGFIGRHLARALAGVGHEVDGIGHGAMPEGERQRYGIREWMNGEIDAANLQALAARASEPPKLVYHLAGGASVGASIAQPYEDFVRTVATTARLLEWVRVSAPECRLVVASSAAVYGTVHCGPIAETARPAPISPYGSHKLLMEKVCQSYAEAYGVRSTVIRLFSVYGPLLRKQLLWDLCTRLQSGARTLLLGGTGGEMRDWTDVRDVARLLTGLGAQEQRQPFHLLNGGSGIGTEVKVVAETVAGGWGGDVTVQFTGSARQGDPFSLVSDTASLSDLAFQWQVPVAQGIEDYLRWFKDQVR
jgi:UDP-glucose 4-epimerase